MDVAPKTQQQLTAAQFGARAGAYVTSAVHAQGEDLRLMAERAAAFHPKTVLDMGCGGGHAAFALSPAASQGVTASDLSAEMLQAVAAEAQRRGLSNIETRQAAAEDLPFADASFCLVASRFSAHHWSDLRVGLRQARRVAKRGALGLFVDVVSPGRPLLDSFLQTFEMLRDPSHVRNYSAAEWQDALAAAGFALRCVQCFRLPIEFSSWVTRMNTDPVHAQAIRSLQGKMAAEVKTHFALADDGSFTLDTAVFEVEAV